MTGSAGGLAGRPAEAATWKRFVRSGNATSVFAGISVRITTNASFL
jgi:hypothetical protein